MLVINKCNKNKLNNVVIGVSNKMGNTTIIDKFLQFEEDNDLLEANIEGFYWWQYVRVRIYTSIIMEERTSYSLSDLNIKKISNPVKFICNLIKENPVFIKGNKDIVFRTSSRRIKDEDSYKCIYTDLIADHFLENSVSIETPFQYLHYTPEYTKNLYYLDSMVVKRKIAIKLIKHNKSIIGKLKPISTKISKLILENFNTEIKEELILSFLLSSYASNKVSKKTYLKIIKKINPKVIILVTAYGHMSLVEASKELGVPTVELQHGVIGRGHIAYNFLVKRPLKTFPDYVFLFSEYWKNARFPIDENKLVATGFPYLDYVKNKYPAKKKDSQIYIVIISQPGLYLALSTLVCELLEQIERSSDDRFRVIVKLHPGEYNDVKCINAWSAFSKNRYVEVIDNNSYPIHYFFAQAHVQVGVSSTSLFEGLAYGLQTYILKYPNMEGYTADMINSDYAKEIETGHELYQMICSGKSPGVIEKYYKLNCTDRIVNYIESFL